MARKALIVWGGWPGHHPKECADLFGTVLEGEGFETIVADSLAPLEDEDLMASLSLVSPMWTMGEISGEQAKGLLSAIKSGVGVAGFHGGMGDAFRSNTEYQWMVGGQFVAHPGGLMPEYEINIIDREHPITQGIDDFKMLDTEQYYMHVDPSNNVLATTPVPDGPVMHAVWTRTWGKGRVFYASYGHTEADFEIPEALEIVKRGMVWAARD